MRFQEQAQRVSIWDHQLRENQQGLEEIVEGVQKLMAGQQDLQAACDSIEAYQSDLEAELADLSADLDVEIEKMLLQEPTDDDLERESTYLLAEDLNQSLNQMENNAKKMLNELNMKADAVPGDGSNPIAKIVAILNSQHESLVWLDDRTRHLNEEIVSVKQSMEYTKY